MRNDKSTLPGLASCTEPLSKGAYLYGVGAVGHGRPSFTSQHRLHAETRILSANQCGYAPPCIPRADVERDLSSELSPEGLVLSRDCPNPLKCHTHSLLLC